MLEWQVHRQKQYSQLDIWDKTQNRTWIWALSGKDRISSTEFKTVLTIVYILLSSFIRLWHILQPHRMCLGIADNIFSWECLKAFCHNGNIPLVMQRFTIRLLRQSLVVCFRMWYLGYSKDVKHPLLNSSFMSQGE